jgi:hypothetical protein
LQQIYIKKYTKNIKNILPLPDNCVEIFVLGRVPNHAYPLEVKEPLTNHAIEQHCFVEDIIYGGHLIDTELLDQHLENWDYYFPTTHNSLVIVPTEESLWTQLNEFTKNETQQNLFLHYW